MAKIYQNGVDGFHNKIDNYTPSIKNNHYSPSTVEEMIQIINKAKDQNLTIQFVNSDLTPDNEQSSLILLDLRNYNKIIEIDTTRRVITIQGGTSLCTITSYLEKIGFMLNIPILESSKLSIAEAISFASIHTSHVDSGFLSSNVEQLEILTTENKIITCSKTSNEGIFHTVCCGLGLSGIILQATLQCKPITNDEHVQTGCSFLKIVDKIDLLLKKNHFFQLLWFPHTDNVVVHTAKKTKKVAEKLDHCKAKAINWYFNVAVNKYFIQAFYWICLFLPFLLPLAHQVLFWIGYIWKRNFVVPSNQLVSSKIPCSYHSTEWAVPMDKAKDALIKLYQWSETSFHFLHFPVDIQFVKRDENYLSPAFDRDICCIRLNIIRPFGFYFPYKHAFAEFADFMKTIDGRPVWKNALMGNITKEELQITYPHFQSWCEVRNSLDPNQIFLINDLRKFLED